MNSDAVAGMKTKPEQVAAASLSQADFETILVPAAPRWQIHLVHLALAFLIVSPFAGFNEPNIYVELCVALAGMALAIEVAVRAGNAKSPTLELVRSPLVVTGGAILGMTFLWGVENRSRLLTVLQGSPTVPQLGGREWGATIAFFFLLLLAVYVIPSVLVRLVPKRQQRAIARHLFFASDLLYDGPTFLILLAAESERLSRLVEKVSLERAIVVEDLLVRAHKLRVTNGLLLVGVFGILVTTAVFVVFAGNVAHRDVRGVNELVGPRRDVAELEGIVVGYEERVSKTKAEIQATQEALGNALNAERDGLQSKLILQQGRLTSLEGSLGRRMQDLHVQQDTLRAIEANGALRGPIDQSTATTLLVATGVTRFGVLLLAIYLVQILIGLFRYNAQVAAHYTAQADALLLLGHDSTQLGELISKLKVSVGFGRPEASAADKAIDRTAEMLKAAMDRVPGFGQPK